MKKILQISNYYYPNLGGIEETAKEISRACDKNMYEVKVLCFSSDAKDKDFECKKNSNSTDIIDGVEVTRCAVQAKVASQSLATWYGRKLKEILHSYNPDIIIVHCPNPFAIHYILKYISNKTKLIVYWHSDIVKQKFIKKFFHRQNLNLLKRADKVIATSPNYIKGSDYLKLVKKKCVVIPSSINDDKMMLTDDIIALSKKIRQENKEKFICFSIGRHVEYKGFEYLIKAAKYLDNDSVVYLGGSGPLTDELKKIAIGMKNIRFLGKLTDEEMVAYYNACDIFCFPSVTKNEAFGLALVEGMYFGKPAITFNIPGSGVNFVSLNNTTGIEVENADSVKYAEAINYLKNNKEVLVEYGKNARERVINNFVKKQYYVKIQNLLKDM